MAALLHMMPQVPTSHMRGLSLTKIDVKECCICTLDQNFLGWISQLLVHKSNSITNHILNFLSEDLQIYSK